MALNLLSREALLTEKKMAGNLCGFLPRWIMQRYKSFVMLMDIRHDKIYNLIFCLSLALQAPSHTSDV